METLYSELYDKYTKLKTKKLSELDQLNKDQEVKFLNYLSAAEELIQHLKTENERLHSQVNDLRSEVASIRSTKDEQCSEYQKLLMEENQKNKELSEEVERLQKLQQVGILSGLKDSKTDNRELCMPGGGQVAGVDNSSQRRKTNKRRRHSGSETGDLVMPSSSHQDDEILRESAQDLHKEAVSREALVGVQKPPCCKTFEGSGSSINQTGPANCLFQVLVEYLVGIKFSTVDQTEEFCISAVHPSSGYSFSLTWVNRAAGEAELLYRALSLGTFERVAPEWMKGAIMFSTTMCPIFFERVSRVVKLHS